MTSYRSRVSLGLVELDFALTDDGGVALEYNPAGQWLWLAEATGLPIAAALADLLIHGLRP